jgi:hypothetical protein
VAVEDAQPVADPEEDRAVTVDERVGGVRRDQPLDAAARRPQHERAAAVTPGHELAGAQEYERRLSACERTLARAVTGEVQERTPAAVVAEGKLVPSEHDDADVRRVGVRIGAVRAPEPLVAAADEQMTAREASPGQVGPVARPARDGEGARARIDDGSGRAEAEAAATRRDDHRRRKNQWRRAPTRTWGTRTRCRR